MPEFMTKKMSKWTFIVLMIPFFWATGPIGKWLGLGFFGGVYMGILLIFPAIWLAKKLVKPEDLK